MNLRDEMAAVMPGFRWTMPFTGTADARSVKGVWIRVNRRRLVPVRCWPLEVLLAFGYGLASFRCRARGPEHAASIIRELLARVRADIDRAIRAAGER